MNNPLVNPKTGLVVWSVFLLLVLVSLIPWLIALVDMLRHEFRVPQNKLIWLLTLLFVPVIGWVLYFYIGRKQKT